MKEKKLRMTSQRDMILDELKKFRDHPSADELYSRLRKKLPRISLATVYRNLEALSAAGIIGKLETVGKLKRFDWETRDHDHLHCVACGRIDNVDPKRAGRVELPAEDERGYLIEGCRIEFTGICPACQTANQQKGAKTMGCKKCGTLTDEQRQVLQALADSPDACGSKDIATATGLESKQVSCRITALKKKGYVDSPVRCKYAITDEGRKALD